MCMRVFVLVNASRLGISSIKKHLCPCGPRLLAALMRTMATMEGSVVVCGDENECGGDDSDDDVCGGDDSGGGGAQI